MMELEFKCKLEEYKYNNGYETSEQAFYVNEQPGNTCPMIDEIVDGLDSAFKEIQELEKEREYDLYWVKRNLEDLAKHAEDARENAEKIRAWGQQWKDIAKRYYELYPEKIDEVL